MCWSRRFSTEPCRVAHKEVPPLGDAIYSSAAPFRARRGKSRPVSSVVCGNPSTVSALSCEERILSLRGGGEAEVHVGYRRAIEALIHDPCDKLYGGDRFQLTTAESHVHSYPVVPAQSRPTFHVNSQVAAPHNHGDVTRNPRPMAVPAFHRHHSPANEE